MGGPGQGKSTVGLFVIQLFRATLIEADQTVASDPNLAALVPEILQRARAEAISTNVPRRYPVYVSLPRYADTISNAKRNGQVAPSLIAYIATIISRECDDQVVGSDVRDWLRAYPWIIVMDGLDEVPPSGERRAILESISQLMTEISDAAADVLSVVTTRPQGYNRDFSEDHWEHWRLAELPVDRALPYAKALSLARYPKDADRRDTINALLEKATKQHSTQRLMVSPLQVTIMHMIVDTGGGVPAARWTLFNEYFEVLRKREKAKGGETQKALERNWSYLGPIHQRAGLILQINSEQAGGAGASLGHERFKELLIGYLVSEGYTGGELDQRVAELMQVALQRLVLLSTQDEDYIRFDVRSFQEFMAAAALTSGDPRSIEARLGHIAGLSHWRHTFLIAASRCFSDDAFHHLRSTILSIARNVELSGPDLVTHTGAKLALEMFSDGVGSEHPNFRRLLADHALDLLDLGPDDFEVALPSIWEDATDEPIRKRLSDKLRGGSGPAALAAWRLLFRSPKGRCESVAGKDLDLWPTENPQKMEVLKQASMARMSNFSAKIHEVASTADPASLAVAMSALRHNSYIEADHAWREKDDDEFAYLRALPRYSSLGTQGAIRCPLLPTKIPAHSPRLKVIPIAGCNALGLLSSVEKSLKHPDWWFLKGCVRFCASPSKEHLARLLRMVGDNEFSGKAKGFQYLLPWPVAGLIDLIDNEASAFELAARVQKGEFGDASDWRSAEKRWQTTGITTEDFGIARQGFWYDSRVASLGSPGIFLDVLQVYSGEHPSAQLGVAIGIAEIASNYPESKFQRRLRSLAHYILLISGAGHSARLSVSDSRTILELMRNCPDEPVISSVLRAFPSELWKDAEFVSALSTLLGEAGFDWDGVDIDVNDLIERFNSNTTWRGLLVPIVSCLSSTTQWSEYSLSKLHSDCCEARNGDSPMVAISSLLLRLYRMQRLEDHSLSMLTDILDRHRASVNIHIVCEFLQNPNVDLGSRTSICHILVNSLEAKLARQAYRMRQTLRRNLDSRRSHLAMPDVWRRQLALPLDAYDVLQKQIQA